MTAARARARCPRALFATLVLATLFAAGSPQSAVAWEPARFEFECPEPGCMSEVRRELAAEYAARALAALKPLGFASPAPHRLGPVMTGADGQSAVRVILDPEMGGYANTLSPCSDAPGPTHPTRASQLTFSPRELDRWPNPVILRYTAHEIVHVIQNAQPLVNHPDTDDCARIPGWLFEGTADALGLYVSRLTFPGYAPSLKVKGSKSFYGLRPWNRSLSWDSGDTKDRFGHHIVAGYRSASLWTHLAEHYFGGRYHYLADFFAIPDLTDGRDDWLNWLDAVLRDKRFGAGHPLYLVFPDFMAQFANWGRDKYPHIGDQDWLQEAFGGCQVVSLSPTQPTRGLNLELEPISAQCVRVVVGGMAAGDSAQVKFMAYGASVEEVDNLHLAAARMGGRVPDQPGLEKGCYEFARSHRKQPACLDKPFTGKRGGESAATKAGWVRTWLSLRQDAADGRLENLYIIAHTPPRPTDTRHVKGPPQRVRLVVGLEHHRLTTSQGGQSKKTTARVNLKPTETPPMDGSEGLGLMGEDAMSKLIFAINTPAAHAFGPGIATIEVIANKPAHDGELEPELTLALQVEGEPIPFGARGRFNARVSLAEEATWDRLADLGAPGGSVAEAEAWAQRAAAILGSGVGGGARSDPAQNAQIEVLAFDDDLLHLSASGSYCLMADIDDDTGRCRNPQAFEAELITPFGWIWDSAQAFVSVDTPGMQLWREAVRNPLAGLLGGLPTIPPAPSPPRPSPAPAPSPAAPDGGAVSTAPCDCSCTAYRRMQTLGQGVETAEQFDRILPELTALTACTVSCVGQWTECPRK